MRSPPGSALRPTESRARSCSSSCWHRRNAGPQTRPEPFRFLAQVPVVGPRRLRDRDGDVWLEVFASAAHRVLLCVTPAVPGSLHCRIHQLDPLFLVRVVRRRRQREQLPPPVVAHHRYDRLTPRSAHMPIGSWIVWVRCHQTLLDREDKIMRSAQGRSWHRRADASETNLESSDCLAQLHGRLRLVVEGEGLDIVKQTVGLREQRSAAQLICLFLDRPRECFDHAAHHKACWDFVKYRFTGQRDSFFPTVFLNTLGWRQIGGTVRSRSR